MTLLWCSGFNAFCLQSLTPIPSTSPTNQCSQCNRCTQCRTLSPTCIPIPSTIPVSHRTYFLRSHSSYRVIAIPLSLLFRAPVRAVLLLLFACALVSVCACVCVRVCVMRFAVCCGGASHHPCRSPLAADGSAQHEYGLHPHALRAGSGRTAPASAPCAVPALQRLPGCVSGPFCRLVGRSVCLSATPTSWAPWPPPLAVSSLALSFSCWASLTWFVLFPCACVTSTRSRRC